MPAKTPDRRLPIWRNAVLAIAASLLLIGSGAEAQNYPWCSNFADGAGTNCGFSTLAQCKDEIMGSGGYCDRNNLYEPPRSAAPAVPKMHKGRAHKSS
jgi:Protein of unknown function (DUF3551)